MNLKQLKNQGIEPISEYELEQQYCEMLDEVYGDVKIAGYEYSTSRALAEVDPTAFRCGFSDWLSSECDERLIEVDGEYFDRQTVESLEEEEEEEEE